MLKKIFYNILVVYITQEKSRARLWLSKVVHKWRQNGTTDYLIVIKLQKQEQTGNEFKCFKGILNKFPMRWLLIKNLDHDLGCSKHFFLSIQITPKYCVKNYVELHTSIIELFLIQCSFSKWLWKLIYSLV